ncbi:hypothetical protein DR094_01180 [Mycoplasma flocculare]|uniref:Methyltransferase n=1 Tax=Mesomycoplasma flocculare TaxID=2128 RepID=A0AAW9X9R5_MESFC|nr:hypothetical protein [Mesomycoplasma flocculare]MXR05615.1 hypothetical protein [Mesomycoplasma flocculare]MXR39202.1 hypothetical protein [Mycoplasma sp. MF12]MXR56609.1 hypothetical protein [Mesomycoplasma flocculare]
MPNWKIILLTTGIISFSIAFISLFWTKYKKNQLIKKYSFNLESKDSEKLINIREQVFELNSEIWLIESLEVIINKINKKNFKKNLFLENDGLLACLSQKNIKNSQNILAVNYLDQEKFNKNTEKLTISGLNLVSFYEPFFDCILISVKIEAKNILEFLEMLKIGGVLILKYQKNQRRTILKFLKAEKIAFDEYFYYDFLIIEKNKLKFANNI